MKKLTLKIVTPTESPISIGCDSIQLTVSDNAKGNCGGSYGIKPGHIESLLSLSKGSVKAYDGGNEVLFGKSDDGFATVRENTVTVIVEKFLKEQR